MKIRMPAARWELHPPFGGTNGGRAAFREGARDRAILRTLGMISIPYALDALNFFAADARNALGPFVNVYLVTDRHWSQTEVGARGDNQRASRHCVPDPDWRRDRPDAGKAGRHRHIDLGDGLRFAHHFRPSDVLADGGRVWRSGDRGRRLCACGRRVDPRGHARIRSRPASRPQLGLRSCRQHRDCHRGWRDRICVFATRGLPDGPGLRNIDHGGGPQHSRERHQSGPRAEMRALATKRLRTGRRPPAMASCSGRGRSSFSRSAPSFSISPMRPFCRWSDKSSRFSFRKKRPR